MIVDLSHTIHDGLVTYKGLPAPVVCDYWARERSRSWYDGDVSFQIGRIEMVANTGTYIDAPFHRYADGPDVSELELERLAELEGVLIEAPQGERALGPDIFGEHDVRGKAVLVRTGWDRHWGTGAYFEGHPFFTRDAAESLRDRGIVLLGVDSYNVDDTEDRTRPVHSILLAAGIPIVEHMTNLGALAGTGFRFSAAPVKVKGMGSFPVRAYATVSS